MDHEAHAGHHEQHDEGQGIEEEVKVGAKGGSRHPGGGEPLDMGQSEAAEAESDVRDHCQGGSREYQGDGRDERPGQMTAQQSIQQEAYEWQNRDQP
jgi:hypothetical protein